jgi:hypothetical protein
MRPKAEREVLREDAARLLDELGGRASAVAASIFPPEVKGQRSTLGDAALATYLHVVMTADSRVRGIKITRRWLVLETNRRLRATIWVRLPHPVREFGAMVDRARPRVPSEIPYEGNQA